jgi:hypothetical protein
LASASPPLQQPHNVHFRLVEYLQQWLGRCFGARRAPHPDIASPLITTRSVYDAYFQANIQVEIKSENGEYKTRAGVAMIDPNCATNLISRKFGALFFDDLDSAGPYPLVRTLAGVAPAIREVPGRWSCTNNPTVINPWLRFDRMMLESTFHVMERNCPFDVIIGYEDILNYDLLDLRKKLPLVAPQNFRSQPYPVEGTRINYAQCPIAHDIK